jgi:hypothetical protein
LRPSTPPKLHVMPRCDRTGAEEGKEGVVAWWRKCRCWWASCSRVEAHLLLGLEVVEKDVTLLGLLTPVLDDDARAVDNLAGVTLAVDLACEMC